MSKLHYFKSTSIELKDDGIMYCRAFVNDIYNEVDLAGLLDKMEVISGGEPLLLLMEMKQFELLLTKEARKFMGNDEKLVLITKAEAVVIRSTSSKILYNLLVRVNAPKFPFKAFTEEREAVTWLLKQG
ncbi:MAG: hypothetical protein ACJATE_001137 [Bacteroidia bacterium]|jgi:hypothetical protein